MVSCLATWMRRTITGAALLVAMLGTPAIAAHPHLFFNASDIPAYQARINDPFYNDAWNEVKIDVRSSFSSAPSSSDPSRRDTAGLRAHAAMLLFDPTTATTNDRYNSDVLFFSYFNAILNAPGWVDFFDNGTLDSAFFLIALATGYDWHYDKFNSSQRTDIINKLAARCDYMIDQTDNVEIPLDLYKPGSEYIHQFKVLRNKFVVQFSALGFVALALEGEVDESRRLRWLNTANACLEAWAANYSDDGVSHESYAYHVLEMQCLVQFLEVKSRKTGVNEFLKYPELINESYYSLYAWVPGGDRSFISGIPMGDGGASPSGEIRVISAIMGKRINPLNGIIGGVANWMQGGATGATNNSYNRTETLQFIFADKNVPVTSPASVNLPTWHFFPEREVFVWRSGWDNNATYFTTVGGRQIGGHMHPDKGNFVIYKGGAPYVAHHYYLSGRRGVDFNLLTIDGAGQFGERYSRGGSTEPQQPSKRAYVTSLLADDKMFNLVMDLKPIYSSTKLQNYTREFVGWGNKVFVRDQIKTSSSAAFKLYNHAYRAVHPTSLGDTLDPDSDPNTNPWGGNGRTRTITPHASTPFQGAMTVSDLSRSNWTGTLSDAVPSLEEGDIRRGTKLERALSGTEVSSLMSYSFLDSGESLEQMPSAVGAEGFRLNGPNGVRAVCAWPTASYVDGAFGLKVLGPMGGIHVENNWVWGRSVQELEYNGLRYVTATVPMSFFVTYGQDIFSAKIESALAGQIEIYAPFVVGDVMLNNQPLAPGAWVLQNNKLRITLPTLGETAELRTSPTNTGTPANTMWLSAE